MEKFTRLLRSRNMNIAAGVILAIIWIFFAIRHVDAFNETGKYIFLVFCLSETLQAFFFVFRSTPKSVSMDPFDWLVALGGTFAGMFFIPGGKMIFAGGEWLLLFGAMIQIAGLISLNRSFAIVAANRAIKSRGMYRIIRHPMYASYIFMYGGYVLFNANFVNVACMTFAYIFLYLRMVREEAHLSSDPTYREYMRSVPWRLIPFVY